MCTRCGRAPQRATINITSRHCDEFLTNDATSRFASPTNHKSLPDKPRHNNPRGLLQLADLRTLCHTSCSLCTTDHWHATLYWLYNASYSVVRSMVTKWVSLSSADTKVLNFSLRPKSNSHAKRPRPRFRASVASRWQLQNVEMIWFDALVSE